MTPDDVMVALRTAWAAGYFDKCRVDLKMTGPPEVWEFLDYDHNGIDRLGTAVACTARARELMGRDQSAFVVRHDGTWSPEGFKVFYTSKAKRALHRLRHLIRRDEPKEKGQ